MDLRLMTYFVAVCEHGSASRAADALFMSQPALSKAIRNLEAQVGAQLFVRSARGLDVTPAGSALRVHAEHALRDAARVRTKVDAVRGLTAGRLVVAATQGPTIGHLADVTARFTQAHPGVTVHVTDPGGPDEVADAVRRGGAEIGVTELSVRAHGLSTTLLWSDSVVLAMSAELAATVPDPVPASALAELPLIAQMEGSGSPTPVSDAHVVVRCAHQQAVWEMAAAGVGAAFLPRPLAERVASGCVLRNLEPDVQREVVLVARASGLSPAAASFVEQLRAEARV